MMFRSLSNASGPISGFWGENLKGIAYSMPPLSVPGRAVYSPDATQ